MTISIQPRLTSNAPNTYSLRASELKGRDNISFGARNPYPVGSPESSIFVRQGGCIRSIWKWLIAGVIGAVPCVANLYYGTTGSDILDCTFILGGGALAVAGVWNAGKAFIERLGLKITQPRETILKDK